MKSSDEVTSLKGVGPKSAALFLKLHISTLEDLLEYFPRDYEKYPEISTIKGHDIGDTVAVAVTPVSRMVIHPAGKRRVCVIRMKDHDGSIREIVWFNATYLSKVFRLNQWYVLYGELTEKNGELTLVQPKVYTVAKYRTVENTYQPVYRLTEGLSINLVRKCMGEIRPLYDMHREYLEQTFLRENHMLSLPDAYENIHFPMGRDQIIEARNRLVFHEFLKFFIWMDAFKEDTAAADNHFDIRDTSAISALVSSLPYSLTGAQKKVYWEIYSDMTGPRVMNRLIQGDVGSGKTIVAVMAMVLAVSSGYQAALMAPTEVLARQHYESISGLLTPLDLKTVLLTGSMSSPEKKQACDMIAAGRAQVIIGTQALIQKRVSFNNLSLVITDEQHRFGVKQRENLRNKGETPHVLVMSATPIPRTLAMMIYGDMDISVMDELPKDRLPIKNAVVGTQYRQAAYKLMWDEIRAGHQCYVICPMVRSNDSTEAENVTDYKKKIAEYMPKARIDCLHGQMDDETRDRIMTSFAKGDTDILVSTTVIEVGINVPNATVMLIENAERFGLASLHQLRGRVGRGSAQSYCIFMMGKDNEASRDRLNILKESNDGFAIAKADLENRGPGDFFGIRQSGDMNFKLADIYQDADLLKKAHDYYKKCRENGRDFSDITDLKVAEDASFTI